MRVLLNWKWREGEIISALEAHGHTVPYYVGLTPHSACAGVFHSKREAQLGIAAPALATVTIEPPTSELIERMRFHESVALSILGKRFSRFFVDQRRHLYFSMLAYWHHVLTTYKIEAIIFDDIPHGPHTYIMFALAKHLGIQTVMYQKIRISDRFLTLDNWVDGSAELRERLHKNTGSVFSVDDLSPDVRDYYILQSNPRADATPFYMKEVYKKERKERLKKSATSGRSAMLHKLHVLQRGLWGGSFFATAKAAFLRRVAARHADRMRREYKRLEKIPDITKHFVYVALHYQPERTTTPQGDVYADQILMIETLAAALPTGWSIFVKEHPVQFQLTDIGGHAEVRYRGYYEKIAAIKNVVLIPVETSTFELIDAAQAIATVTGTVGFEALMRRKPVLVFGYPWYQHCSEIFMVNGPESCTAALKKVAMGYVVREQALISFLKSFDEASFHGYIQYKTKVGTGSQLSEKTSMDGLIASMLSMLVK